MHELEAYACARAASFAACARAVSFFLCCLRCSLRCASSYLIRIGVEVAISTRLGFGGCAPRRRTPHSSARGPACSSCLTRKRNTRAHSLSEESRGGPTVLIPRVPAPSQGVQLLYHRIFGRPTPRGQVSRRARVQPRRARAEHRGGSRRPAEERARAAPAAAASSSAALGGGRGAGQRRLVRHVFDGY